MWPCLGLSAAAADLRSRNMASSAATGPAAGPHAAILPPAPAATSLPALAASCAAMGVPRSSAWPRPRQHSPTGVLRGHVHGGDDLRRRPVASPVAAIPRHPQPPPAALSATTNPPQPTAVRPAPRPSRGLIRGDAPRSRRPPRNGDF